MKNATKFSPAAQRFQNALDAYNDYECEKTANDLIEAERALNSEKLYKRMLSELNKPFEQGKRPETTQVSTKLTTGACIGITLFIFLIWLAAQ